MRPAIRAAAARNAAGGAGGDALDALLAGGLDWLSSWEGAARAYSSRAAGGLGAASPPPTPGSSLDFGGGGGGGGNSSGSSSGGSIDGVGGGAPTSRGDGMVLSGSAAVVDPSKAARVREAFANGSLSFGFSAGGLMFPYYVGVVSALEEMGVLSRPHQLAGASAGSLVAAAYNAGLDMRVVEESMILFGEDCLANGTRYRLGPLLRDFLHAYLPPDAHERCAGNTHVAWTRVLPYWRPQLVTSWRSREDLIESLLTSCHIPWYFDGRWMTKYRGHFAVDGGATNFIPVVPGSDYTCKVMCFPTWHLEALRARAAGHPLADRFLGMDISLDSFEEWPHGYPTVIKWALQASTRETTAFLIDKGKRDARAWVVATGLDALLADRQLGGQQHAQHAQHGTEGLGVDGRGRGFADVVAAAAGRQGIVLPGGSGGGGGASSSSGGSSNNSSAVPPPPTPEQREEVRGDHHPQHHHPLAAAAGASTGEQQGAAAAMAGDQSAPGAAHGRKRPRAASGEEEGGPPDAGQAAGAPIPGLTGQPRSDTAPLHDREPAGARGG